jgi:hypothetical protein
MCSGPMPKRLILLKISGGFRSLERATNFAIIRSAIGTALKQGWNVIQVLSEDSKTLAAKLQAG